MSVNVYDVAYELEKGIRQSKEYIELQNLLEAVNKDEVAKKMFDNFRQVQMTLQQKQMTGQEITQEEVEQAQKLLQLVQQNPTISKLMEAEQRMSMLIGELNKIIMKPLEDIYGMPQA
ncbi:YlbF family regulator [Bacillus massiliigorillae]|uniref:YlbF family regulator n=1 Tax=Bacillus massiliigorillae TaxID=1243664 RepID=UPI0003A8494E|nr:YlbF family regulator [Bacillus massiliigorillae]